MPALLSILAAIAIGSMLALRFARLREFAPRWAGWLLIGGCGAAAGIGLTSVVFLLCRMLAPRAHMLPMLLEAAIALWLAIEIYRMPGAAPAAARPKSFPWTPALALALIVVLGISTAAMSSFWDANPEGNWDAWAIWNLRAHFLAADATPASRAWSPLLSGHPEYPLLVSGFVARCWSYSGAAAPLAPIATGYVFFLALIAIGTGGLAALSSGSMGLLFGLIAASSPFLLREVPAQYADIPLACFFAGAVMLMLLDRPALAGLLASFAAWTKDEGLLFLAVFLLAVALPRRKAIMRAIAGAAPAGALVLVFKLALAHGANFLVSQGSGSLASKLLDPHRYASVLGAIPPGLWDLGSGWYHPILPLLALCALLRFKKSWRQDVLPAGAITACMLVAYFLVYVIAPSDLNWQVGTTLSRLAAQIWPIGLIAILAGLRPPEDSLIEASAAATPVPALKHSKKRGR